MPEILSIVRFGDLLLRRPADRLSCSRIRTTEIQSLVANMHYTLEKKRYGVGLAAPQVGQSVALAIVAIKPTPTRPDEVPFVRTLINPRITTTSAEVLPKWEACISGSNLYAQVPRFESITLEWYDQNADKCTETFGGLAAHVIQHEVDHLDGRLFVDRVVDPTSYMVFSEYKKMVLQNKRDAKKRLSTSDEASSPTL